MNRKLLKNSRYVVSILLIGLAALVFSGCRKDRSMTLTITAKMLGDTTQLVPNAKVILDKDDIHVEGYTDLRGEFRHTFNLQIQLDVVVTKDTLKGIGKVNVGDLGEDVDKTIYIW